MILKSAIRPRDLRHRGGFSLTELAIVMAIMGIILASLWGVTSLVRENTRRDQAVNQIAVAVRHIRDFYMGRAAALTPTGAGDEAALTSYLLEQNVLPFELFRARTGIVSGSFVAENPWGSVAADGTFLASGGFFVCSGSAGCLASDSSDAFAVRMVGLKKSSCMALASRLTGPAAPAGLMKLSIDGTAITLPLSPEDAAISCGSAAASHALAVAFRLRVQEGAAE